MDPNANLKEQREIVRRMLDGDESLAANTNDAQRLAELVEALDEWISKGGFLPAEWTHVSGWVRS